MVVRSRLLHPNAGQDHDSIAEVDLRHRVVGDDVLTGLVVVEVNDRVEHELVRKIICPLVDEIEVEDRPEVEGPIQEGIGNVGIGDEKIRK